MFSIEDAPQFASEKRFSPMQACMNNRILSDKLES
jgi:hypothetical protein